MTDFSKIFGEFVGAQWGDVGIAPYEPPGSAQKFVGADASVRPEEPPISPQAFAFRICGLRGDRVVAPYGENGEPGIAERRIPERQSAAFPAVFIFSIQVMPSRIRRIPITRCQLKSP